MISPLLPSSGHCSIGYNGRPNRVGKGDFADAGVYIASPDVLAIPIKSISVSIPISHTALRLEDGINRLHIFAIFS